MLWKVDNESGLSKIRACEWYKAFKEGRKVVEDSPRPGRTLRFSTDENIKKLNEMVMKINKQYYLVV